MSGKPRFSYEMAVLERIMQMKQQGMSEPQISQALTQQGISPREINEAFSQSKIKSAINQPGAQTQQNPAQAPPAEGQEQYAQDPYAQQGGQEQYAQDQYADQGGQEQYQQEGYDQGGQEQYPQEGYDQGGQEQYQQPGGGGADIETMNDIAEQIVEEKISKLRKQVNSFSKFQEEINIEMKKINDRLTKIENVFNELQISILKKIGEYGSDLKNISKEMQETQNTFSKMVNPVLDNKRKTSPTPRAPAKPRAKKV